MSVFSRFRHKDRHEPITDDEWIARYFYLLDRLPGDVIEKGHASVLKAVPDEKRAALLEMLRSSLPREERGATSDDPKSLATLMGRANARRLERADRSTDAVETDIESNAPAAARGADDLIAVLRAAGLLPALAVDFMLTGAVSSYFLRGPGALGLAYEPQWVWALADPHAAGFDAGVAGRFDAGYRFDSPPIVGGGGAGAVGGEATGG
ncbi:hypothetical protein ABZ477_16685 [Microbacterium sp. NPDC019599]|uniref:hypothetical protein n=1 Tax=Microbacterium sp. NPDC019599 TaxID=3154690 RepID=UPI0034096EDF